MSNRDVAIEYVQAFCSGDLARVADTLAADFSLTGPLYGFASKDDYLESLSREALPAGRCDIIEVVDGESAVSVFYDYVKPAGRITVAQLFRFEDGRIAQTVLVFDQASVGSG